MAWHGIAIFVTVVLSSALAVEFVTRPASVAVPLGGTALFQCALTVDSGTAAVYWYKGSNGRGTYITKGSSVLIPSEESERYSVETGNSGGIYSYNLKITAVKASDVGQYQCFAVDTSGSTRSPRATLSVVASRDPPTCSFQPESPSVEQEVTFSCTAPSGVLPDVLSWWMDGPVRIQSSHQQSDFRSIAFVKTLTYSDNFARFTCLIGESFGNSQNCSLMPLAVPIRARITPETAVAAVGGSATFQCRGTALPPVTKYRWIYGSGNQQVKISTSRSRFVVVNSEDSSSLTIAGLTTRDNDQTVRCVVVNGITKNTASAVLQVGINIDATREASYNTPPLTSLLSELTSRMGITSPGKYPKDAQNPAQTTPTVDATKTASGSIQVVGCREDCGEKISPQQNPQNRDGSSSSKTGLVAALSILAICALVASLIVYLVYKNKRGPFRGRVVKRKRTKNKALQRLRSLRTSLTSAPANQVEVVNKRDSIRLKTIEVVVNPPPPEWQFRVHDVVIEEQNEQEPDDGDDQSPSPKMTSSPDASKTRPDVDALYAKPDKMKKKKHQARPQSEDVVDEGASAPPTGLDDCLSDGLSDASTWEMSSVDSGCEDEAVDLPQDDAGEYAEIDLTKSAQDGTAHAPRTDTEDYADIPHL